MEGGVCLTISSRLKNEETFRDWPVSIRVAVSIEMTEDDIARAVAVIHKASMDANQQ